MAAYQYANPRGAQVRGRARVRWDRLGRVAMLGVLAALLFLYIHAGLSLYSTWRESSSTTAAVGTMKREYHQLRQQHAELESPAWIEMQARRLGMVFPGERQYYVRGLPDR